MRTFSLVLTLLVCTDGRGAAQTTPAAEDLAAQLGVDASSLTKIRAGQVFQASRPDLTERDLAVGFVFASKASPDKVAHEFLHGVDLNRDPSIVASHRISAANAARDLEALHLTPGGDAEAKKYRGAQDGDVLNLSSAEIAAFRGLPSTASVADTEAQLRKMLLQRYESYRKGGVAALAPYARDNGRKRDLGEGLRVLEQSPPGMKKYATVQQAALRDCPKLPPSGEEAFYWIVYNHDDRPTVTLRHRLVITVDGTPVDTGTDRVGGASQSMKHSIGRRMMAKQMKAIIERTKAQLDR